MIRVVVLTSKENFVWYSMQEIIPYIESSWESMNTDDFEVVTFNIDTLSLAELTPKLIGADKLVITCFNYRMCKVMQYIREILKLNLSFIIHVHNLSTIAFWPYRYFSSSDLFYKSDVFITSCKNDKSVLQAVFADPIIHVVPFFTKLSIQSQKASLKKPKNIVYVGRISPQKNLHNLLLAYSLVRKRSDIEVPPMVIFGKEDHLGSPNMNIRNENYQEFLEDLVKKLEIQNFVYFKGHVDRDLIEIYLNDQPNLFVSPSLHSDENFGMAALQSILSRNRTLLSDWGGHSDFRARFPHLVEVMPVKMSEFGPSLNAMTIAGRIEQFLIEDESPMDFKVDEYYLPAYYDEEQKKAASHEFNSAPLMYTALSNAIYDAKMDFTTSSTQIFASFNDPLFHQISRFYIGSSKGFDFNEYDQDYQAVPWLTYTDEIFMIDDPHKGPLLIQNDHDPAKNFHIYFSQSLSISVSRNICERLFKAGYINKKS